jgi:hypothetical protein
MGKFRSEAAPSADGIFVCMMCVVALNDVWLPLFNVCWSCGIVPSIWSKSVIVPVPKARQRGASVPGDFRGFYLTSVVCKVFCLILNERLPVVVAEENRLLADEQGGFRKGRGCAKIIVSLVLMAQTQMALRSEGMMTAFIDFQKAYDRVDRQKSWSCLWQNGVN